MKHKKTYINFLFLICISVIVFGQTQSNENNLIQLISSKKQFEAGSTITLHFASLGKTIPLLYCANNYGSTLVRSTSSSRSRLSYTIPKYMSNKSGILHWSLTLKNTVTQGQVTIQPKTAVDRMETYLGNPVISVGGSNYTSMVVIPTDDLDNPLNSGTPVLFKQQFLTNQIKSKVKTNNYIAYKKIFSPDKRGRMLLSSESFDTNSKEYTVDILPGNATNFSITAERNHDYADGNQITSFITSVIKDRHGNRVSDGTHITFFIRTKEQDVLKTSANTIHGIATAKMIHPEQEDYWNVQAVIPGIAKSNTLAIKYKRVIKDFDVQFTNNNQLLTVGPLTSFMDQMIPDGLPLQLTVFQGQKKIQVFSKTSLDGFVSFELSKEIYENKNYSFEVRAAGITKKIQVIR